MKKTGISLIACVSFLSFISACSNEKERNPDRSQPDEIVTYKTIGDTELTLHFFYPEKHKTFAKKPAIVFFFGGGWINGAPGQFFGQSRALAELGMVAINADYRVEKRHGTSPSECVKDGKSALRWVRKNAGNFGIDPNRIAAGGGSAGGHIAAATALVEGFNEEGEDISVDCRPNALVLFNPVFDNSAAGYGYDRVKKYWQEFSPMHNIKPGAPPTLVMLGTQDKLIPVATAEKYKALMESAGARCDLKLYEDQPHGFFNKIKYDETLADTIEFLKSLGYIK
ncbi:MAG: alpha/beta hydrolase fold domain-containing protein [Kiritimatiellales bacterium]